MERPGPRNARIQITTALALHLVMSELASSNMLIPFLIVIPHFKLESSV
jgi:hypothetical protein